MTLISAIIYLVIIIRLMFFDKTGMQHKPHISLLAYIIIISAGYSLVYSAYGIYEPPHEWEVILELMFAIIIINCGGNLSAAMRGGHAK